MTPRSNRIVIAAVFGLLWAAGMMARSPSVGAQTVVTAAIAGVIVAVLAYGLLVMFSGRSRG